MSYRILQGDVMPHLLELETESVHCVVTSPPYWRLRDYGTASWDGGDIECDHKNLHGTQGASGVRADRTFTGAQNFSRAECKGCGAVRIDQQIGLEDSPEEYIAKMVAVFREIRRVLRKDGTIWLNMGDSYAGSWGSQGHFIEGELVTRGSIGWDRAKAASVRKKSKTGSIPPNSTLKPKDIVGIPWRLAFALQSDGWWLRQDIIWHKPNPMPESVTDRCTKAHEYIFLLSKSERYYYDADAIREPQAESTLIRFGEGKAPRTSGPKNNLAKPGEVKNNADYIDRCAEGILPGGRNKRSVWTINTQAYPEAHFATFPEELIVPCILAGCPIGGTVLDPFSGSGTAGVVALRYHRNYIGIELSPEYAAMSERRITSDAPLFNKSAIASD